MSKVALNQSLRSVSLGWHGWFLPPLSPSGWQHISSAVTLSRLLWKVIGSVAFVTHLMGCHQLAPCPHCPVSTLSCVPTVLCPHCPLCLYSASIQGLRS